VGLAPIVAAQAFKATGVNSFAGFTQTFAGSGGTQFPENLSNNGRDYSVGFGAKAGLIWQATDTLALSLAYQSKTEMTDFDKYADLFAARGSFDIPAVSRLGLSWQATDHLRLHADVEHAQYSRIASVANPLNRVFNCPTSPAGGSDLESCFGGARGAGFGWGDVTTYKLGASYRGNSPYVYRLGYSYGEQPISGDDVVVNILAPGVVEQHFTAGLTRRQRSGSELGIAVMYAPEKSVSGANAFDPTQAIELRMDQLELEVSWRW
jgi:long-chain fatty acid transport protein